MGASLPAGSLRLDDAAAVAFARPNVLVSLASVAGMEHELIKERMIASLAAARAKGGTGGGRKSVMTPDMLDTSSKLLAAATARQGCEAPASRPLDLPPPLPANEREPAS